MVGKKILGLVTSALLITSLVGCGNSNTIGSNSEEGENTKFTKIGITQIVEHPALDSSREGFLAALKDNGYEEDKNIKVDFQNAQGDMPTTQTIAQKFVDDKVDMIFAISTPSAQAAYNATKEIPILITAVTDPVAAELVASLDSPKTNVTGTSDATPIDKQLQFIVDELPNVKKVGIMYNTSESNSEIQVNQAKEAASKLDLEIVTQGVTSVNDIPQTLNSMIDNIDAIYIPTDNMIASSMPIITSTCFDKNIPVIASESGQVDSGAIVAVGIDYYQLGYETGLKAVEVIEGKATKDIPVTFQEETSVTVNQDALDKLEITLSENIMSKAEVITGGVN